MSILDIGTRVRITPVHARRMLPADRPNRDRLMALRGDVTGIPRKDIVAVDFGGLAPIELHASDVEAAED